MRLFLVSNMYPSSDFPNYGIFVKNFEFSYLENGGIIAEKVVIDRIYTNVLRKSISYLIYYFKIIFKGLFSDYNIIYVHYVSHNSLPIYILRKLRRTRLILNFHGDDLIPRSSLTIKSHYVVRNILKNTDLVVLPSLFFQAVFLDKFIFDRSKIFISPSGGIDSNIFNENDKLFDRNNITLGFVSRIDRGKGWRNFLKLVYDLQFVEGLNITGVIVGDGFEIDSLKGEVLSNFKKCNLKLFTKLNHLELASVYKTFDLFIFPSELPESLGLVGIEAMACGVPCIGSSSGGITSYVKDGFNGFTFNPVDYIQLLNATVKYINLDPCIKNKMKMNSIETASFFDRKNVGESMYNRIKRL